MVEYSQYKVNELKDLLRERNLSLGGTKSELIRRLEEHDASEAASTTTEPTPAQEQEPATKAEPANATEPEQPVEAEDVKAEVEESKVEEPKAEAEPKPEPEAITKDPEPTLGDDDYLEKIKSDLESQIQRAKRFGGNSEELEARLRRILKFGVGAVRDAKAKADTSLGNGNGKSFNRRRNKKVRRGPKPATA